MSIKIEISKYNKQDVRTYISEGKKWFCLYDIIYAEGFDNISLDDICSIPMEHMIHLPNVTEDNRLTHLRFIDKPAINILKERLK